MLKKINGEWVEVASPSGRNYSAKAEGVKTKRNTLAFWDRPQNEIPKRILKQFVREMREFDTLPPDDVIFSLFEHLCQQAHKPKGKARKRLSGEKLNTLRDLYRGKVTPSGAAVLLGLKVDAVFPLLQKHLAEVKAG